MPAAVKMEITITPEKLTKAKEALAAHRRRDPNPPVDQEAIQSALDHDCEYFITTRLYWDCECKDDYIRTAGAGPCPQCNAERDEMPDSRIGEMATQGIVLDWLDPGITPTYDQHNLGHRPRFTKN